MGGYSTKNYTEQGGDVTHIGGKLVIEDGATVEGLPSGTPAGAKNYTEADGNTTHIGGTLIIESGASVIGLPVPAQCQSASTADTVEALKDDFNFLLTLLKSAGLMQIQ